MRYLLLSLSFLSAPAFAADSAATAPAAGAIPAASSETSSAGVMGLKKFEETSVITDAKLKADAGSLTVVSLKANLAYYGPPVADLEAKDQPNPDGVVSATKTAISGSLGARYRFSPTTSISSGAGVKNNYPFHNGQKMTMSNPYLSYDTSFRLGGVQMVAAPGVTLVTEEAFTRVAETWGVNAKLNGVYNLGESGFAVGADTSLAHYFFSREYDPGKPAVGKKKAIPGDGAVQRIALSINPNVKYNLTPKLSAITSWGFSLYNPRAEESRSEFRSRTVNQRVGVGYAVTRDVYLSPYIQFYPTQFSWRTATANISTVFSVL